MNPTGGAITMCARSASGSRSLPYYASSLVGREDESALLQALIDDPAIQLITITGPGGVGKTRLAVSLVGDRPDNEVIFVPLSSVEDADLVLIEIGKALDIHCDRLQEAIRDRLESWDGVLLLDNFEQVIVAATDIAEIIPPNPELTVIITSQRALQIDGERVVRLDPLPIPEQDAPESELLRSPSVQLLVNRATEQDSSFPASLAGASTSNAIAEICRRLDGIPLALELAASRLNSLSPEVVLAQLENDQSILSGGRRDAPTRHRTMHATIAWSVDLLPDDSRRTLTWLGPFTAGFDLGIVERVSAQLGNSTSAFDIVNELIQLSLIRRVRGGPQPWYTMLASIREYAIGELNASGDRANAEALVSEYVLELANTADVGLARPIDPEWNQNLEQNFPTIRSAVHWSLSQEEPDVPMMVGSRLVPYLEQSGRWREGAQWIAEAENWQEKLPIDLVVSGLTAKMDLLSTGRDLIGATETQEHLETLFRKHPLPELEASFLLSVGHLALRKHDLDIAADAFDRALTLNLNLGNEHSTARANANLGHLAYLRGDYAEAEKLLLRSVEGMRATGDRSGVAAGLQNLANVANLQLQTNKALSYLEESIQISRDNDLTSDLIHSLLSRAVSLVDLQQLDEALEVAGEVIELCRTHDYTVLAGQALYMMGGISYLKADYAGLGGYLLAAMEQSSAADNPELYAEIGNFLASSLAKSGRYTDAASAQGGFDRYVERIDYLLRPEAAEMRDETIALVQAHSQDSEAHFANGRSWSTQDWVNKLKKFARRLSAKTPYLLVTVPKPAPVANLTAREQEILQLLIDGQSTQGMADMLNVSPRTITTHIGNMMAKMDVNSRTELVSRALRNQAQAGK